MPEVMVVGDATVDIIVPYPKFLNKERTLVEYPEPSIQGGGTSANTAVALARLGVETGFVGSVGEDQYGRYVKNDLSKEGVDISGLIIEPELNTVGVFAFIDETESGICGDGREWIRHLRRWMRIKCHLKRFKRRTGSTPQECRWHMIPLPAIQ